MKKLMFAAVALAGILGTGAVQAEDTAVYFVSTNAAALSPWTGSADQVLWGDVGNWQTADGEVPALAPVNGEDIVFAALPANGSANIGSQRVTTWKYSDQEHGVNPSVGAVTGGRRYVITHGSRTKNEASFAEPRRFTVQDPNGFDGIWQTAGVQSYFTLPNDGSRLGCLNVVGQPYVEAPTAGSTVKIGELSGFGVLEKTGPGALEIECPMGGADTSIRVSSGDLVLHGEKAGELEGVLAQAYVQLDASAADSFVTSNDTTLGWTRILRWNDARAGRSEIYAYGEHEARPGQTGVWNLDYDPAVMAKEKSPTDRPLVSFGACPAETSPDEARIGPVRSILKFNKDVAKIREIFFAAQLVKGQLDNSKWGLFGYSGADANCAWNGHKNLFSSATTYGDSNYHSSDPRYGEARFNGARTAVEDIDMTGRTDLFVAANAFERGVYMNRLGTTRNYNYLTGNSYLGEVLVFTNVLTRAQRILVDNYLNAKWRTGAKVHLGNVLVRANGSAITVPAGETVRVHRLIADGGTVVKRGGGILEVGVLVTTGDGKVVVEGGRCDIRTQMSAPTSDAPADGAYFWLDAEKTEKMDTTWKSNWPGWEDLTFVRSVKDRRDGVSTTACPSDNQINSSSPDTGIARFPTLQKWTDPSGKERQVLDFGKDQKGTRGEKKDTDVCRIASYVINDGDKVVSGEHSDVKSFASFVVIRPLTSPMRYSPFNGWREGGYTDMDSGFGDGHVAEEKSGIPAAHIRWSIDGQVIDPYKQQPKLCQTSDFIVLAVASQDRPFHHDMILQQRYTSADPFWYYDSYAGRAQIAELITYRRPLSEREIRDTEAYLMQKWLKKDHPDAAASTARIVFGPSAERKIVSDADMDLSAAAIGGGAFTKGGDGEMTLSKIAEDVACADFTSLTVEGGTLALGFDGGMLSDAVKCIHVDPNDTEKTVTREVDDPALGKIAIVDEMNDVDGRTWASGNQNRPSGCRSPTIRGIPLARQTASSRR